LAGKHTLFQLSKQPVQHLPLGVPHQQVHNARRYAQGALNRLPESGFQCFNSELVRLIVFLNAIRATWRARLRDYIKADPEAYRTGIARKIALSRAQGQETEAGRAVAAKSRIEDGRRGRTVGRSERARAVNAVEDDNAQEPDQI
jgi:hypothetical protein